MQLGFLYVSGSELGARRTGMKAGWKQASVGAVIEVLGGYLKPNWHMGLPVWGTGLGKLVGWARD